MRNKIFGLIFTIALFVGCGGSDNNLETSGNTFDRTGLLTNIVDNLIIPSYVNFQTKLADLKQQTQTFIATQNQTNLDALRTSFQTTYLAWQKAAQFEGGNFSRWGPSSDVVLLRRFVNIFPTKPANIENAIENGGYNLETTYTIQGLPALDYLLYGVAPDDTAILAKYNSDTNAQKRRDYLLEIVNKMIEKSDALTNEWKANYKSSFISSNGTDANSSVSKILNGFSEYYEQQIRKAKLGGPLGKFTQGTVYADDIETIYSKKSKEMLLAAHQAATDFYIGKHFGSSTKGKSFKDYVASTEVKKNGNLLADEFLNELNIAKQKIEAITGDYHGLVVNKDSKLNEAYSAMQQVVATIKIEIFTALNSSISYQDNDGD